MSPTRTIVTGLALTIGPGCDDGEGLPTMGACEMRYTDIEPAPQPIRFCTQQESDVCSWVQATHGDKDLDFHPDLACEDVGFPICCGTPSIDIWFLTQPEAEAAREEIAGESCAPC